MSRQFDCIVKSVQTTTVPEVVISSIVGGVFGALGGGIIGTLTSLLTPNEPLPRLGGAPPGAPTALQTPTDMLPRMVIGMAIGAPVGAALYNIEVIREKTNRCMEKQ